MQKEKKKGRHSSLFCTSLTYITDIKYRTNYQKEEGKIQQGCTTDYTTKDAPHLPSPSFGYHQSSTSWRSSPRPFSWRDELLWERLWEDLNMGMNGGDCMPCKSGDLEMAVLFGCSEYVPLHDAARDLENELLPLPEGVMMLSMLGCRWKLDCTCIGGGGEAYEDESTGKEDGPS
jgi:hypothetical protein